MVKLESIFERDNMNFTYKRVVANNGSAGVDGMEVQDILEYLKWHSPELVTSVKDGSYKPQLVLRVIIPKEEKVKFRPPGIPTVTDRWI